MAYICYFTARCGIMYIITLKASCKTVADDILFLFIFILFFRKNEGFAFHVNRLLADDSHEMPGLNFSEK